MAFWSAERLGRRLTYTWRLRDNYFYFNVLVQLAIVSTHIFFLCCPNYSQAKYASQKFFELVRWKVKMAHRVSFKSPIGYKRILSCSYGLMMYTFIIFPLQSARKWMTLLKNLTGEGTNVASLSDRLLPASLKKDHCSHIAITTGLAPLLARIGGGTRGSGWLTIDPVAGRVYPWWARNFRSE